MGWLQSKKNTNCIVVNFGKRKCHITAVGKILELGGDLFRYSNFLFRSRDPDSLCIAFWSLCRPLPNCFPTLAQQDIQSLESTQHCGINIHTVYEYCRHHRLRGSASPVLTATHHSYGSLAWLSDFFFPHSSRGQTPQPIFTQNGSIDVDSRKDVPFAVKIATFHTP